MGTLLAIDIDASAEDVFELLTTTEGQAGFWTSDCEVGDETARFGFEQAPVDLHMAVESKPNELVRFTVTSGFPFWNGSVIEWQLGPAARQGSGTQVVFRHDQFEAGYPEVDLAYTSQHWAGIQEALKSLAETGKPAPAMG